MSELPSFLIDKVDLRTGKPTAKLAAFEDAALNRWRHENGFEKQHNMALAKLFTYQELREPQSTPARQPRTKGELLQSLPDLRAYAASTQATHMSDEPI